MIDDEPKFLKPPENTEEMLIALITKSKAGGFNFEQWSWYGDGMSFKQNINLLETGYYHHLMLEPMFLKALFGTAWKMHAMNAIKQELNKPYLGLCYLYKHSVVSIENSINNNSNIKKRNSRRRQYASKKDA